MIQIYNLRSILCSDFFSNIEHNQIKFYLSEKLVSLVLIFLLLQSLSYRNHGWKFSVTRRNSVILNVNYLTISTVKLYYQWKSVMCLNLNFHTSWYAFWGLVWDSLLVLDKILPLGRAHPDICYNLHFCEEILDKSFIFSDWQYYIDGLVQERCNSIANALELRLSCTKPSIYSQHNSSTDGEIQTGCIVTGSSVSTVNWHT